MGYQKSLQRTITPDYLTTDFNTFVQRQIEILKNTEQFKDYNFEGSNIRLLMEWFAYLSELNTFYLNKIAKNSYDDTADVYENVHRIAKMKGYNPRGYISSKTDLTIKVKMFDDQNNQQYDINEQLYIPAHKQFFAETDNGNIRFVTSQPKLFTIPNDENIYVDGYVEFSVPIVQGEVLELNYTGKDIIDGKLILPFYNFNHDPTDSNDDSTIIVTVNDEQWYRVENFYSEISGLRENNLTDNVFMFVFDKYKRYLVEFSQFRKVPGNLDEIKIVLLKTLSTLGNVGSHFITNIDSKDTSIMYNNTRDKVISNVSISVTNLIASSGGTDPQSISEISAAGKGFMNAQERCVIRNDYISYLKSRADIITANVWGEHEINKKGDIREYNKIHLSVIPYSWNSGTISVSAEEWELDNLSAEVIKPIEYSPVFIEDIKTYLEKRKFLLTYEVFDIPDIIYFMFRIGVKIKRLYNFADVSKAIKDKLDYYFDAKNRSFGEKISFMEISNFITDPSIVAEGKNWDLIKGIDSLVFRDIKIKREPISQEKIDFYSLPLSGGTYWENGIEYSTDIGYNIIISEDSNIYPPNKENDYPQYTKNEYLNNIENKMKIIVLGPNQFPMLVKDLCIFEQEID